MPFAKGASGNPGGRPKEKLFSASLRLAVSRTHDDDPEKRKKLAIIAEKLVECAISGEPWAIQQIADRLDGKPAQETNLTVDDKRDATDWTRAELVAFLNDVRAGSGGASKANGSGREPDSVH